MANEVYEVLKNYYICNYTQLCNYVSTYIGNDRLSQDLVHDAFLVIMDKYLYPPDEKKYKKMITKILKNSIMTYFRETGTTISIDNSFFDYMEIRSAMNNPEKELCMEKLVNFFEELENPGKMILYLNLYERFSLADISRMTGEKQRNIYYWKNKALEKLRAMMEEAGCGDKW
ncbi:MAG TPA: sigma-70 family RNA polymerase sigma factor [Clostridia bacterium]|nr:sigma-70 family RNA polymerase sigma factor [Clostridia bacterium]HPQ46225.1 sigma-70 family RNA polymerase sigma factor [Clostridia bacterium]